MAFAYLWKHRSRYPLLSPAWAKTWGKRLWQIGSLTKTLLYADRLRRSGATIGQLASFSSTVLEGNRRNLRVGSYTFVGRVEIQLHAPVSLGDCVVVNDGARIITGSHEVDSDSFLQVNRPVVVGSYAWICTGAILLPGVVIGIGAVVGAGAVVSRDVADYAIVVGNPARVVKRRTVRGLTYRPTQFRACYEAWINKPW